MDRQRRHLAIAGAAAAGLALAAGGAWWARGRPAQQLPEGLQLALLDGRRLGRAELRGQVLLVNFWATSCAVCVAEMPDLAALHLRWQPRGLQTFAVAMPYDPPARVAAFAEQRQLPFGVVIDLGGAVSRGLGPVEATPTTLLVDRDGRIVERVLGRPDFAALDRRIGALLGAA